MLRDTLQNVGAGSQRRLPRRRLERETRPRPRRGAGPGQLGSGALAGTERPKRPLILTPVLREGVTGTASVNTYILQPELLAAFGNTRCVLAIG